MYFIQRGDELFPIVRIELSRDNGVIVGLATGLCGSVPEGCEIIESREWPAPQGCEVPVFEVASATVSVRWQEVVLLRSMGGSPVEGLLPCGRWSRGVALASADTRDHRDALLIALSEPGQDLSGSQLALLLRYREIVAAWPVEPLKVAFTTEGEPTLRRRSA